MVVAFLLVSILVISLSSYWAYEAWTRRSVKTYDFTPIEADTIPELKPAQNKAPALGELVNNQVGPQNPITEYSTLISLESSPHKTFVVGGDPLPNTIYKG